VPFEKDVSKTGRSIFRPKQEPIVMGRGEMVGKPGTPLPAGPKPLLLPEGTGPRKSVTSELVLKRGAEHRPMLPRAQEVDPDITGMDLRYAAKELGDQLSQVGGKANAAVRQAGENLQEYYKTGKELGPQAGRSGMWEEFGDKIISRAAEIKDLERSQKPMESEVDFPFGKLEPKADLATEAKKYKTAEEFVRDVVTINKGETYDKLKGIIKPIPVKEFSIEGKIQVGQPARDKNAVNKWIERIEQGERPPVIWGHLTSGGFTKLIDGHHRLEAYKKLGFTDIPAISTVGLTDIWDKAQEAPKKSFLKKTLESEKGGMAPDAFTSWLVDAEQVAKDVKAVGRGVKAVHRNLYPKQEVRKMLKVHDSGTKLSEYDQYLTQQTFKKLIPDKKTRTKATHMLEGTEPVAKELVDPLKQVRQKFNDNYKLAKDNDVDVHFLEDYVTHVWEKPEEMMLAWDSYQDGISKLGKKAKAEWGRSFPTIKFGKDHGFTPKTEDIAELVSINERDIKNAITRKKTLEAMQNSGTIIPVDKIPDGTYDQWIKLTNPKMIKLLGEDQPLAIRADIAKKYKGVLEPFQPGKIANAALVTQAVGKRALFLFNPFFHALALGKSAAFKFRDLRYWKGVKKYKEAHPDVRDALDHGVHISPPNDMGMVEVQDVLDKLYKRSPILGAIPKATQYVVDKWLWGKVYLGLKVNTYTTARDFMMKKYGNKMDQEALKERAGEFVNDIYGGINWKRLAKSNEFVKWSRLMLIAPDWTVSNLRSASGLITGLFETPEQIKATTGKGGLKGRVKFAGASGRLYAKYWKNILLTIGLITQGLNFRNTERDEGKGRFTWNNSPEHKWDAYLFTDEDGEKHYADTLGFLKDNLEMMADPGGFAYRKGAHIPKMVYDQLRNKNWMDKPIVYAYDKPLTKAGKRLEYAGKAFLPIAVSSQVGRKKPAWMKFITTMGVPIKGDYPREAQEYMSHLRIQKTDTSREIYHILKDWGDGEIKDKEATERVDKLMAEYNQTADRALGELSKKYKFEYDAKDQKSWGKWFISTDKIKKGYSSFLKRKGKADLARILGF